MDEKEPEDLGVVDEPYPPKEPIVRLPKEVMDRMETEKGDIVRLSWGKSEVYAIARPHRDPNLQDVFCQFSQGLQATIEDTPGAVGVETVDPPRAERVVVVESIRTESISVPPLGKNAKEGAREEAEKAIRERDDPVYRDVRETSGPLDEQGTRLELTVRRVEPVAVAVMDDDTTIRRRN